jgi:predicted DNA-binding transcriptional regulator YafY
MTRLTPAREAEIRQLANRFPSASQDELSLLAKLDAVRAERDSGKEWALHTAGVIEDLRAELDVVPDWMRAERAEATLAAIRAWAERQVASVATDKAETGYLDGSSLTAKVCVEDVLALLDAPPSPEKG